MDRIGTIFLLTVLQLVFLGTIANNCCNEGNGSDVEVTNCNRDCQSDCDCSADYCKSCQGNDKCCQSCCNSQCNCQSVSCTSCSSSNNCCSSCCSNTKCRSSSCSSRSCRQCNCDNCSSKGTSNNACCNSCCTERISKVENVPTNVSQITTLPNITIIINHAPIYVNNTPVINTEHRCGNASVLTNGTHIVYVYPQNSTCNNRTCCSRMVRPRCNQMIPPMPPVCPPPVYVSDCSSRCNYPPPPMPMPMPVPMPMSMPMPMPMPMSMPMPMPMPMPQQQPCQYFQSWPYVHCPQTGCYGYSCAPPSMPMPMAPPMYTGCIPLETWPFVRCIPGMNSDSVVSYGPPFTQLLGSGMESAQIPFSALSSVPGVANVPPM